MKHMTVGDTYDRLRVEGGARNGGIKVAPQPKYPNTEPTQYPRTLATNNLTANTAVINGGFFRVDSNKKGKPVGPTKDKNENDFLPIPNAYRNDYGTLNVGDEVGISSGPILEPGKDKRRFEDARFQRENMRNYSEAGSLVHADNEPQSNSHIEN